MSAQAEEDQHYLVLPCEDEENWEKIKKVLSEGLSSLASLDEILNHFSTTGQKSKFFSTIPGNDEAKNFDFDAFWEAGVPLMFEVALQMPSLFANQKVPLLLAHTPKTVPLSHRQVACLLAHSFFGSITADARKVRKEKWAFRATQLFFLEALPSALCFLNYFKRLGKEGIPDGDVVYERRCFEKKKPTPWEWESCSTPLCPLSFVHEGSLLESPAQLHADFANRFVGGGALENDFMMEEILFVVKPELIVSMALCSFMHDEESVVIKGAKQYSSYSGYSHSFTFEGDYSQEGRGSDSPPPIIAAMDALQGMSKIQFNEKLILRDMNKARIAFSSSLSVATGNWGCGAFGNDHMLKFCQQWMAASEAGAEQMYYYTYGDKRTKELPRLAEELKKYSVKEVYEMVLFAAKEVTPGPGGAVKFRKAFQSRVGIEE